MRPFWCFYAHAVNLQPTCRLPKSRRRKKVTWIKNSEPWRYKSLWWSLHPTKVISSEEDESLCGSVFPSKNPQDVVVKTLLQQQIARCNDDHCDTDATYRRYWNTTRWWDDGGCSFKCKKIVVLALLNALLTLLSLLPLTFFKRFIQKKVPLVSWPMPPVYRCMEVSLSIQNSSVNWALSYLVSKLRTTCNLQPSHFHSDGSLGHWHADHIKFQGSAMYSIQTQLPQLLHDSI